jgi:hypothetical protein
MPDKAIGFVYDAPSTKWVSTQFDTTKMKYVIAPANNNPGYAYSWTQEGEKTPNGFFRDGFNRAGVLVGKTIGGEVRFNKNNGRYLMFHILGYYTVGIPLPEFSHNQETDENTGTPMLQIGKCSPF